jgi:predicted nucleic acid-binding protein
VKVVDAGVVVELLVGGLDPDLLGDEDLAVPHLIDSEVTNVLRRLVQRGDLSDRQGSAAMRGFLTLALSRYPAEPLRSRMWQLRHNLSGYDATYVALAEALAASSLVTTDRRMATAPGIGVPVEVL